MRKAQKLLAKFLKNNKGSSIVTILVAMFFVSALGAMLLFASYTGLKIKVTEQRGVSNFYNATEVMDQIRSGVQIVASDAVTKAYTDLLINYTGSDIADKEKLFNDSFINYVLDWKTQEDLLNPDFSEKELFTSLSINAAIYEYNLSIIEYFLISAGVSSDEIYYEGKSNEDAAIKITGAGSVDVFTTPTGSTESGYVSINDLTVSFTDKETAIETSISTDIVINIPPISLSTGSGFTTAEFPEYALISDSTISKNNLELTINGSVYGRNISLSGAGSDTNPIFTTINNSTIISPNKIEIGVGHSFNLSEGSQAWVDGFELFNNANIFLNGNSYVQDDLVLTGNESEAYLNGNYYGFGNGGIYESPVIGITGRYDARQSSSIVINGYDTKLDLDESNALMLAGHSFIIPKEQASGGILMGESISVNPNQLAYLIPYEYLNINSWDTGTVVSNPYVYSGSGEPPNVTLKQSMVLWEVEENGTMVSKNLGNYGNPNVAKLVMPITGSNDKLVYYFYEFRHITDTSGNPFLSNIETANEYFADYFEVNKEEISEYLTLYTDLSNYDGIIQTSGNYIVDVSEATATNPNPEPIYELVKATEDMMDMETFNVAYNNFVKTLSYSDGVYDNPYDNLITTSKVNEFINANPKSSSRIWEFQTINSDMTIDITALLIDEDFVLNEDEYMDVKLIISTSDVTVNREFSGLIITDGNIIVNTGSINADKDAVIEVFDSIYMDVLNEEVKISRFLTLVDEYKTGQEYLDTPWELSDIVVYDDWKKS